MTTESLEILLGVLRGEGARQLVEAGRLQRIPGFEQAAAHARGMGAAYGISADRAEQLSTGDVRVVNGVTG